MKKKYRIVIIGAGFAGFNLAKTLQKSNLEVYLIDRNNFHQFQPLYYQVATAALEPASISFPLRKAFQKAKNIHIRMAEVIEINTDENHLITSKEVLHYDRLVIATGANTNFFGNEQMKQHAIPMKSVSEAIHMRNHFLQNLESAYYADAKFPVVLAALKAAQHHIHVEYYIFYAADAIGKQIINILCDKASEGVEVRLLVDGFGSKISRQTVKQLETAGVVR